MHYVFQTQCKSYAMGMPFSDTLCNQLAERSVGKLADNIMGKGEIVPGQNCRSIEM